MFKRKKQVIVDFTNTDDKLNGNLVLDFKNLDGNAAVQASYRTVVALLTALSIELDKPLNSLVAQIEQDSFKIMNEIAKEK